MTGKFSVYYDGSCPLCRKEIGFYQQRRGADEISWVNIADAGSLPADLSCETAMRRFHVRDQNGKLLDGGIAFAALWRQLPAFRWLGWLFSRRPFSWLLNLAYELFLPIRPMLQRWVAKR